jgi:phosphatidylcholine synthase
MLKIICMRMKIGTNNNTTGLILAWLVHFFTGIGALIAILAIYAIHLNHFIDAFWLMGISVFIDAVDGTLARAAHVKTRVPQFDGALLDNIIDYLNYVIIPCFILLVSETLLPSPFKIPVVSLVTMVSAYQFCQTDAKTDDHYFKGFPCYWNFAVFYMLVLNTSKEFNAIALCLLSASVFVPIKYIYPSRLDYFSSYGLIIKMMHAFAILFGISSLMMLIEYPLISPIWIFISSAYIFIYMAGSLYRTCYPMKIVK